MMLGEHRLGIESVYLRRSAVQKKENNLFCFWCEMRVLGQKCACVGPCVFAAEQIGEPYHAEAIPYIAQSVTSCHALSINS